MVVELNPRLEYEIKELVTDIAGRDRTISNTASDLIKIGIAVRSNDIEPEIVGPMGIPRPFAKIRLGDQSSELRTEISEEMADQLVDIFDNKPNTAAREAIRLGILAVAQDEFTVQGPIGGPRPFAKIKVEEIDDTDINELIKELQTRL